MNSCNWDIIPCYVSNYSGVITGLDDALIFVGGTNQQPRQFQISSTLERGRRFGIHIKKYRRNFQITLRLGQRRVLAQIAAHDLRQLQSRLGISALRALDLRIKLASLHCCACKRAAIGQPSFVTIFLSSDILLQPLLLFFPDRLERSTVERRIKRQAGLMKLLYDRDIKLLLCDQNVDIATPERRRHGCVKQGLREEATGEGKRLGFILTRPVPALDTGRYCHCHFGPYHRTKNKTLSSRLFDA